MHGHLDLKKSDFDPRNWVPDVVPWYHYQAILLSLKLKVLSMSLITQIIQVVAWLAVQVAAHWVRKREARNTNSGCCHSHWTHLCLVIFFLNVRSNAISFMFFILCHVYFVTLLCIFIVQAVWILLYVVFIEKFVSHVACLYLKSMHHHTCVLFIMPYLGRERWTVPLSASCICLCLVLFASEYLVHCIALIRGHSCSAQASGKRIYCKWCSGKRCILHCF
jgi:hypothetical protein